MKQLLLSTTITIILMLTACTEDEFTTSQSAKLNFSTDTVKMDTVFSKVPSTTRSFMVYNRNKKGLRITNVRLSRGNQTGFRVNVDGTYLGETVGYQTSNIEMRGEDSIRVLVEITSPNNYKDTPQQISDDIIFTLESGQTQKVNLNAWSWDAIMANNMRITKDTTLSSPTPYIIYGGITIDSTATLTIQAPATLYFHSDAGINVYGTLKVEGTTADNVVMRGDRLDKMFTYLPYDRVPGQWQGITIHPSSFNNEIYNADIHSSQYGIICDSTVYDSNSLRLSLFNTTIHNCQGPGLQTFNSNIALTNCQITNTSGDCVAIYGGKAQIIYCTIAQFYPFTSNRGAALRFSNQYNSQNYPLEYLFCANSIITGYAEDVIMGEAKDSVAFDYQFINNIMRTPAVEDSLRFINIIWETTKDSVQGEQNFKNIDIANQYYDFHLDSLSRAVNSANPDIYWHDYDRDGQQRDEKPDMGCYELK